MIIVPIEYQIPLSVEDDILVDDDFVPGDNRVRSTATKRIRPASRGDGITDSLLCACHLAAALLAGARAVSARCAVRRASASLEVVAAPGYRYDAERQHNHKTD